MSIEIIPTTLDLIESHTDCLDSVARERQYLAMIEGPPLERVREFVQNVIDRGYVQFFAVEGRQVVGWCDITPVLTLPGFEHVGNLGMGVRRAYRGRGIGRRLIETTLQAAREKGLERIELEVFASNAGAISLYEKVGFVREGLKRRARKLDGVYDDLVVMGLLL